MTDSNVNVESNAEALANSQNDDVDDNEAAPKEDDRPLADNKDNDDDNFDAIANTHEPQGDSRPQADKTLVTQRTEVDYGDTSTTGDECDIDDHEESDDNGDGESVSEYDDDDSTKHKKSATCSKRRSSSPSRNMVHNTNSWDEMYEALLQYKKRNRHVLVPKRHPGGLGDWVIRQRCANRIRLRKQQQQQQQQQPETGMKMEKDDEAAKAAATPKKTTRKKKDWKDKLHITQQQIEKLDKIGFVWDAVFARGVPKGLRGSVDLCQAATTRNGTAMPAAAVDADVAQQQPRPKRTRRHGSCSAAVMNQDEILNDDDRKELLNSYLRDFDNDLTNEQVLTLTSSTIGWWESEIRRLIHQATMAPVREYVHAARLRREQLQETRGTLPVVVKGQEGENGGGEEEPSLRSVEMSDFEATMAKIKPTSTRIAPSAAVKHAEAAKCEEKHDGTTKTE
jgi:Helicase associated domain